MRNIKKIITTIFLIFMASSIAFAGGVDEVDNNAYINGEVDSTIREITQSIDDNKDVTQYVFYYSQSCSHCQKVMKFFTENGIEDKFNLVQKDTGIYEAAQELVVVRRAIGLDPYTITVPFLVYKENGNYVHLDGDVSIISFFQGKLDEYYPDETNDSDDNSENVNNSSDSNNSNNGIEGENGNSDSTNMSDDIGSSVDPDVENQNLLLYFILTGLVILLGGGSFIILKKK